MQCDELIRTWIIEVIRARPGLVALALRQRAKFEGWLKFELAAYAEAQGAEAVEVESALGELDHSRSDLTFTYRGRYCGVELKTCNTNWRIEGARSCTRPITKNIKGIIADAKKLENFPGDGIVAFCMFPVPSGDGRWTEYLDEIGEKLGLALSVDRHTARISISIGGGHEADVVVIAFAASKDPKALSLPTSTPGPIPPA